jgi:hypothetical protein
VVSFRIIILLIVSRANAQWYRRYLLTNICILGVVILLASADVTDPVRFARTWQAFILKETGNSYLSRNTHTILQQLETLLIYTLQTLCTLVSSRTLNPSIYTPACKLNNSFHYDWAAAIFTALLSWFVLPSLGLVVLAAFTTSIGPAPITDEETLDASRKAAREAADELIAEQAREKQRVARVLYFMRRPCGKLISKAAQVKPMDGECVPSLDASSSLGDAISINPESKKILPTISRKVTPNQGPVGGNKEDAESLKATKGESEIDSAVQAMGDILESQRLFWPARFGTATDCMIWQHRIFNRHSVVRVSYREFGMQHVLRVFFWKVVCLSKLMVGYWDRQVCGRKGGKRKLAQCVCIWCALVCGPHGFDRLEEDAPSRVRACGVGLRWPHGFGWQSGTPRNTCFATS